MVDHDAHSPGMEPLARAVREAMDAEGLTNADVERITGLDRRHISQILNRAESYTRPPTVNTMQSLAKLPGLTLLAVAEAVAESVGIPTANTVEPMSPKRRSVHAVIDKIPEDQLDRALQILVALL